MTTHVPWRQILAAALHDNEIVSVGAAVRNYLRREPTRSEITAARRAATRYAAGGHAQAVHIPRQGRGKHADRLVLTWPETNASNAARLTEFTLGNRIPASLRRSPTANAAAARALALELSDAAAAAEDVDRDLLAPVTARLLAADIEAPLVSLQRFHDQLVERALSNGEITPRL